MKYLLIVLLFVVSTAYGQLSMDSARNVIAAYRLGYSTYFEPFVAHAGYGAPWILTHDGGAAAFGDNMLYKFDKTGKEEWMRRVIPEFNELESQSVAEDTEGNLYVFMLSYDSKRYRGGSERVLCYNNKGELLWDKTLGAYTVMNNPTVSYIRSVEDGRIYMRGHVVREKPLEGKDPVYRYWEGWLDSKGKLSEKTNEVIDWGKDEWQKKFKPED
jgi:outer membrane protein assembly factor BamB